MNWIRSLGAVDTIRAVREIAEAKRDVELDHALKQIAAGKDPETVLKQLAHRLTNKLLHEPSAQLKQAGYDGRTEVLKAARDLFDLKTTDL